MNDMLSTVLRSTPLARLLGESPEDSFVGYVYNMAYNEVYVAVNDASKIAVGGIPHNGFLVAAGFNPERFDSARDIDKEVVLLRVLGPQPLPQDGDHIRTRIEHHQRRTKDEQFPDHELDGLDTLTASELMWGGLKCRILGTFFISGDKLRLGSDIESYLTLSRLRVFKPKADALETIVNHVNPEALEKADEEARKAGFGRAPAPIDIGTVRYTSTARLHRATDEDLVPVRIQPSDFLARRTSVLGMTRTGKSNTVKNTVSAVAISAMRSNVNVGQLIFDVNGEYANANHQDDGSSIAEVFTDAVRYRALDTPGFEDLRTNFYLQPAPAMSLIQGLFAADDSPFSGQDLDAFMSCSLDQPDPLDKSEHTRWKRHVSVFQCVLQAAGYKVPDNFHVEVPVGKALVDQLEAWGNRQTPVVAVNPPNKQATVVEAQRWWTFIRNANLKIREEQKAANIPQIGIESSTAGNAWVDPLLESMLNMLVRTNSSNYSFGGYRAIQKYRPYHSHRRQQNVIDEVIQHLTQGRIVILDLSVGPVEIRKVLSERIARQIFERQMAELQKGNTPQNVVIYVEEAHNLIGKKCDLTDTWPRIAKEGAKAKIAFVYATQEPSSVHPNILANTENWFVTHLNNDDELRTLAKFYDFGDFLPSLKMAQDVGFARLKTLSSPFVVPTQINRFTPSELQAQIAEIKAES